MTDTVFLGPKITEAQFYDRNKKNTEKSALFCIILSIEKLRLRNDQNIIYLIIAKL